MSHQAVRFPAFRITVSNGSVTESCACMAAVAIDAESVICVGDTASGF
jgi:hypothetical protein